MLLSFKFLIACPVGVQLFISEENWFVISIEVALASSFFRRAERRGIQMKLIRLQLYHCISCCICILGTLSMFHFQNNRQGVGAVLIGHMQFRSDCFQKECQLNMQLQIYRNMWFQLVCDMVMVGTVETCCLERKAVLFVAESQ